MKRFCRKGHPTKNGKRWLALLMCVCLIGTMFPITAMAEAGDAEVALSEDKLITDWEWVDDWEIIDPDSGNVLLPFASAENVAYFDDIVEMLPTAISAGGEELTLGEWVCEDYPMEGGAYEGEYIFETTLPEGYVLSEDSNNLCLTVVLGNSDGYDAEVYAYEPIDTTLAPGSTLDVSKIPMGCLTPRRYFIREKGTYTITGYNSNDTTARFVIYESCTIVLKNVNLKAGITYEDGTDVYYGSGERGVFEINSNVNVNFDLQGSNRIVAKNYYHVIDQLNAILLGGADGQITFSGTGSLHLGGRIAPVQRASGEPYKVVMNSGSVECFGFGNRNARVIPNEVVSADNSKFVYEGGNFYNYVDDDTSYWGVTKGNTTGDIYRVKIPVSSSTVQVKIGADGSFSTAKAISGNIYVWNSGKVTDYYVIDGSNYYHYRSTNSTGSNYLTNAVKVTDDASISGAKGTVKVGGSAVSDAALTFTGEQFTGNCTTDSNGAYDKAMPRGTYQVSVKLSGSDVTYNMGTITLNQESKQTHDFGLTTLTGKVTDTSETPNLLSNARISVEYDGTSYTAVSGSDGTYTMVLPNGIAPEGGTFSVTANHLMASSKTKTVTYQAPSTICNFALTASSSTEINVYTEDDLIMLSEFADQLSSKTINLMNDITLTGRFQGIKRSDNYIEWMTFNGNGHTIENLTTPLFQRPGNFVILNKCTVTDLHLKGEINDGEHLYVGALATIFNDSGSGNAKIDGCSFEGSINSTVNNARVGGLVGSSSNGATIKNSFVRLTEITATSAKYMGGIVGNAKADIYNSYAIIKSFGGAMLEGNENNRGSIVGGTTRWIWNCYAVVESKETSSVVHRMGLGGSNYQYNFSYGPGVFDTTDETDKSHATDLSLNLMTAAAGSGTEGDNEPLVDRLNANTGGFYKTWYNGTDGYPCFTIPTYTITFSGGTKGAGSQEAKSVTLGESVTLPGAVYKNSDYVQKGWATSENSTTKAYELGASISPTANMTLYPYWEAKPVASCEAPTGLTAMYGDTLSKISLPDGFTWNAPSTSVGDVGTYTFTATYTPRGAEAETYRKNTNVQISVEVKKAPAIYNKLVNKVTNLTYNRTAQELVTAGTTSDGTIVYSLTGNDDYTSTIPTATDPGVYTVYYKILGDTNHEDSEAGSVTVSIGKANLKNAVITLGDALTYNGEEQTQSIASVTVGTMTLGEGDYTVTGNTGSAVGTYTLTVAGIGNFEGSKQKEFAIGKKTGYTVDTINKTYAYKKGNTDTIDLSALLPSDCGSVTYGEPQGTASLFTQDGAPVVSDGKLSYTVTEGDTDKIGTITVTVSSENYANFTITVNVTLKGRIPVEIAAIGITDKTDSGANVYLRAIDEGEYGIDNYYLYYTTEPLAVVTAETVKAKGTASPTGTFVLSGLPEDTTYYLYAIAEDTYGNASAVCADSSTTWVKAPEISPAGGSYVGSVSVSLSAGDGTTIYYTTDGSEPTEYSTLYTQAFTLTASATVKAIAVKGNNGSVTTQAQFTIITGGLPTTPTDHVTQAGDSTTADLTDSTVSKGGETITTVDQTTADKLVDKAVANNSEEVIINAETKNSSAASSTKSAEVTLPAETLGAIAEKTDADVVIKTDVAEVKLDNKATEAIASQAQAEAGTTGNAETVSIVAEKVKEGAKEVRYELKVVTSSGKVISDFNGGSVSVTVNVPKSLSGKNLVCVYIDDNGLMHKVEGQKNADGTYTFTTGHFSTYAILAEEEADAAIAEQIEAINSIQIKLSTKVANTKTGKKGIKLTWKADTDIQLDGIEVFRSVKSKSGYKKIYTTKKAKNAGYYINTKSLKKNTKYYYKVRGFVTIDGQKVYTAWSNKGIRTFR